MATPLPLAVLVSGTGTNLQALLDTVHGQEAEVIAVVSNVADAPALERARSREVPTKVFARGDYADRPSRDAAMAAWLVEQGARLVVLAGYMELLSPAFLERFPGGGRSTFTRPCCRPFRGWRRSSRHWPTGSRSLA